MDLQEEIRLSGFHFKTTPFWHQFEAFMESRDATEFALFMEMGTGKTKVVIDTSAYLYDTGKIDAVMIFANKGSYRNWTTQEIPKHMPDHVRYFATHWDAGAKGELLASYDRLFSRDPELKIFVVNIEALSYERGIRAAMNFARPMRLLMVIDESTTIKNRDTKRTKMAIRIGQYANYRRIMTGSPITKSPMDLFAQCEFLNPALLGYGSYYSFQNHYADLVERKFGGGANAKRFKSVVGYKHLDELQEVVKRFSYRIRKDECLNLPAKIYQTYDVELTDEQERVYRDVSKKAMAELQNGELVTGALALTRLLRLHQVVCGIVKTEEGNEVQLPNNRLNDLLAILEETSGKVVIWATYRSNIENIAEALGKEYGEDSVMTYYGGTSDEDRETARRQFAISDSALRFIVGNPSVGGYGTDFLDKTADSETQTVIYYSNHYSLEKRLQSEDRSHRIGQLKHVNYIDLIARGTIDEKITKALRESRDIAAEVLGDPKVFEDWLR